MTQRFEREGVSFQYPTNWQLEEERNENGWSVSLQSPGTAFLFLSCDESMPTMEEVAETALQALREEYPDLEADVRLDRVAGEMAIGHDVEFFHFDLTNTCSTRTLYSQAGTLLLLSQVSDAEEETYGPVLRAVRASLQLADE